MTCTHHKRVAAIVAGSDHKHDNIEGRKTFFSQTVAAFPVHVFKKMSKTEPQVAANKEPV